MCTATYIYSLCGGMSSVVCKNMIQLWNVLLLQHTCSPYLLCIIYDYIPAFMM
jgi:hypothetical protein